MGTVVACYGGAPVDVAYPGLDDIYPLPTTPLSPYPTPKTIDVITIRGDLTDAEREGLAKLLPIIDEALSSGTKLDREQIAAYVFLQSLTKEGRGA
jgi:hypothetical protein